LKKILFGQTPVFGLPAVQQCKTAVSILRRHSFDYKQNNEL